MVPVLELLARLARRSIGGRAEGVPVRIEVLLPKWGMTMQEGTIASWLVSAGDVVAEEEPLAVIETEKVETELPAPAAGRIDEIVVAEGETVEVGTVIAWIEAG